MRGCRVLALIVPVTDAWEKYIEIIPLEERGNVMQAYHKRLTSDDIAIREEAAAVSAA